LNSPPAFDRERLLGRTFPVEGRTWTADQALHWARDFGIGLPGAACVGEARFLDPAPTDGLAHPMTVLPLCDGAFWQRNPDTGIDWAHIVHAEETLTVHRAVPLAGSATLAHAITDIRDRGAERGASMVERLSLAAPDGQPLADIDVTTVLRRNGGFGGPPPDKVLRTELPDRAPDASIDIDTPSASATRLCISGELTVASGVAMDPGQCMLRGLAGFAIAGRAVLTLACGNRPERLRRLRVRYGGPLLTDETLRVDFWHTAPGSGVLRMRSVQRGAVVLSIGTASWDV
jgi:hypothetical protein